MKKLNKFIAAAVISGLTLTGAAMVAQAKNSSTNDALAVTTSSVTLEQAIGIAQQAVAGTPAKAEFSTDDGTAVWEVEMIDKNQQAFDLEIDATSGKVLKQAADKYDHEDDNNEKGNKENDKEDKD
ncbi:MAG: PepSY domain-containing protein [Desulforhopalus sp.]|nr:PepSY domain-containing protein [Desulforhopalus sp.]